MVRIIIMILFLAAFWMIFKKMGREGWEGIVPLYNTYIICEILYGNGWKMLLFLIPFYNIYFAFKVNIDLAKRFNLSTGFGVGLVLLSFVFYPILGFGKSVFDNGEKANKKSDFLSDIVDKSKDLIKKEEGNTDERLEKINKLLQDGTITQEEYNKKRKEILDEI